MCVCVCVSILILFIYDINATYSVIHSERERERERERDAQKSVSEKLIFFIHHILPTKLVTQLEKISSSLTLLKLISLVLYLQNKYIFLLLIGCGHLSSSNTKHALGSLLFTLIG